MSTVIFWILVVWLGFNVLAAFALVYYLLRDTLDYKLMQKYGLSVDSDVIEVIQLWVQHGSGRKTRTLSSSEST